jgi:ribonuclease BN (tRNA processing enzyme)
MFIPWVLGRDEPLEVYGPPGIKKMTEHILEAYREDIQVRLSGLEPANETGYKVNCHEIEPGYIYDDLNVKVEVFRVKHGNTKSYGIKFNTSDRIICISGDTAPFDSCVEIYRNCDVLIHEVYAEKGKRTPEWQKYHESMHTSSVELGRIAEEANPGLLILYHQLFHGVTEEELIQDVRAHYGGKVVSGHDLDVY